MARNPIEKAPKVWFTFCQAFHQDFSLMGKTFEEALFNTLDGCFDKRVLSELKIHLESLVSSELTDGQLKTLFKKGGAQVVVRGKKSPMRALLTQCIDISSELLEQRKG